MKAYKLQATNQPSKVFVELQVATEAAIQLTRNNAQAGEFTFYPPNSQYHFCAIQESTQMKVVITNTLYR